MPAPLILIVDDQPFVADVTRMVLKHAGMDVLIATTAAEALEIWQRQKAEIDLLLADFDLDGRMTGEELAQEFRKDKPGLKSIILSAYPLDSRFKGRIEGIDFFQKPWDCNSVVAAVRKHLAGELASQAPLNQ